MSDTAPSPSVPAATDTRTLAIIVYGLYICAVVTCGVAGLVGVVIAYIKRDEARGTVWHSQDRKSTRLNSSHTEIYTLSLHDALPIWPLYLRRRDLRRRRACGRGHRLYQAR